MHHVQSQELSNGQFARCQVAILILEYVCDAACVACNYSCLFLPKPIYGRVGQVQMSNWALTLHTVLLALLLTLSIAITSLTLQCLAWIKFRSTLMCRHLVECFHTPAFIVWWEVHLLLTGHCIDCKRFYIYSIRLLQPYIYTLNYTATYNQCVICFSSTVFTTAIAPHTCFYTYMSHVTDSERWQLAI